MPFSQIIPPSPSLTESKRLFYTSVSLLLSRIQGYCYHLSSEVVKSLSHVRLFATPWTVAYQAPPSMGFSRQEYWSGLPLPSPGDLPDPGIESGSPAFQADALTSEPPGKPFHLSKFHINVLVYCIGVFLSGFLSLCIIGSSFIHLIRTDSNVFFLMAE